MNKEELFMKKFGDETVFCLENDKETLKDLVIKLQQENKQLKDNWNKLKEIAKSQSDFKLKCHNESLWFEVDELLNKMQELEKRK